MERNSSYSSGKRLNEEHFYENILNLGKCVWICHLKIFLLTVLFSGAKRFVQFWLRIIEEYFCKLFLNLG